MIGHRVPDHRRQQAPLLRRGLSAVLVSAPAAFTALSIDTLASQHGLSSVAVAEVALGAVATVSGAILAKRVWDEDRTWIAKPYLVADRPAVRYETAAGDYMKFERYHDGVSANWSTADGPHILMSIPFRTKEQPVAQFWTSDSESEKCGLSDLAPELLRNQTDVIRAWVETDSELIVWRLADAGAAGIAQLGVLMRSWDPRRVLELVGASATKPVQNTASERLEGAQNWMDSSGTDLN